MKPYHALVLAAAFGLAGCLNIGPRFRGPETGIDLPDQYQHDPRTDVSTEETDRWWEDFGDPEIEPLVAEMLENNLDIRKTTAAILELWAEYVRTRADRLPGVDLKGEARKQKQPIFGIVPGMNIVNESDQFTLSLPASFELDLWGRLARAQEASRAELLRAEENRRTLIQSMVAETITIHFQLESLERRIAIAEQSIESFQRSLAIVENRYERGLVSVLDVRQSRRTLAQAETALPQLRQDLGTAQHGFALLLGRYPETRPAGKPREAYFRQLPSVPPGLPSELLLKRPDIRAAEASLRSLNAMVGMAKASRFPRIVLTGTLGYTSNELNLLVRPESELWNMAGGITQPLLHAGQFKAAQRAAEARYAQGLAEYAKTVLGAFSEVEGSLLTRQEQLERRKRTLLFLDEARATQAAAEGRYERGLVDYLTVLEAQQVRFQAEESLVLVDLAILSNRVTLYRALGGTWAEPREVENSKVRSFLEF